MLIYAHRGDSISAPENTLRAFELAIAAAVDGIELDVHTSADGVPIVLHDRGLDRTTSGSGNVDEQALAEIRQADAGGGQRVPTLDEALDVIGDRVRLDLEIKQAGIEQSVLDTLVRHPNLSWAISCFDWNVLRELRRLAPNAELWPLSTGISDDLLAIAKQLESPYVAVSNAAITVETASHFAETEPRLFAWTVNEVDEAKRLDALGVAAICTDNPSLMKASLG